MWNGIQNIVFANFFQVPHTKLFHYAMEDHGFESVTLPMFSFSIFSHTPLSIPRNMGGAFRKKLVGQNAISTDGYHSKTWQAII